jgi:hypothetical protein
MRGGIPQLLHMPLCRDPELSVGTASYFFLYGGVSNVEAVFCINLS